VLTNDEILDAWRAARQNHAKATGADYGNALFRKMAAEEAAIERFGLGPHKVAYRARFPDDAEKEC
jgi:hypothetical protein